MCVCLCVGVLSVYVKFLYEFEHVCLISFVCAFFCIYYFAERQADQPLKGKNGKGKVQGNDEAAKIARTRGVETPTSRAIKRAMEEIEKQGQLTYDFFFLF